MCCDKTWIVAFFGPDITPSTTNACSFYVRKAWSQLLIIAKPPVTILEALAEYQCNKSFTELQDNQNSILASVNIVGEVISSLKLLGLT